MSFSSEMRRSDMRMSLLVAASVLCALLVSAQDKFPVTRMTFDPAQDGFPSWFPDGKSFIHSRFSWRDSVGNNGIWKIVVDSKKSRQIYSGIAEHPKLSPDGRLIVFDSDTGSSMSIIEAGGGKPKKFLPDSIVIRGGGLPCWSPSGSLIAFKDATPSLCVYDIRTGRVERIFRKEGLAPLPGGWSPDGQSILIALSDRQTRKSTIWRISPDGKEKKQITGHHENFWRHLALSPDGSLLVYAAMEGKELGLWVMRAEGGKSIPLAITHPGHNEGAAWSPDGKRLAFNSTRSGNFDIWMMGIDVEQLKKELQALNE
jgi:TolB protein